MITAQDVGVEGDTPSLVSDALPKEMLSQPALIVGLIASLTGSTLPKDIAKSSRKFLHFGQDILEATGSDLEYRISYCKRRERG